MGHANNGRFRVKAGLVAVLTLAAAFPLSAQHRRQGAQGPGQPAPGQLDCTHMAMVGGHIGMMSMPSGQMMPGMGADIVTMPVARVMHQTMLLLPARILEQQDELKLTSDQVTRLVALRASAGPTVESGLAGELMSLFAAPSPDLTAVEVAAERAFAEHARLMAGRVATAELRSVQRVKDSPWSAGSHP